MRLFLVLCLTMILVTPAFAGEKQMYSDYHFLGTVKIGPSGSENTYPSDRGTDGQFLKTNGAGVLSWADPATFSTQVGIFDEGVLETTTDQINFVGDSISLSTVEGRAVVTCTANVTSVNGQTGPVTITAADLGCVTLTGDQDITGIKTFYDIPVMDDNRAPTQEVQLTNKKYVDDQVATKGTASGVVFAHSIGSATFSISAIGDGVTYRNVQVYRDSDGQDITDGIVVKCTTNQIDIDLGTDQACHVVYDTN